MVDVDLYHHNHELASYSCCYHLVNFHGVYTQMYMHTHCTFTKKTHLHVHVYRQMLTRDERLAACTHVHVQLRGREVHVQFLRTTYM